MVAELKRLIVSADDVGLDPGVTAGALAALADGIVTSLSVLVVRPDWAETLAAVRASGAPSVGVHLSLSEGRPVLPPDRVPTLVEDGRFVSPRRLLARHAAGRLSAQEVQAEWTAQIERAQSVLPVTHVDGHKHLHVLPGLVRALGAAADARGIERVRLPREPGVGPRLAVRAALSASAGRVRGLRSTDRIAGVALAGRLRQDSLVALLAGLRPGTTELVAHPGSPGPTLPSALVREGMAWAADYGFAAERDALCSREAREAIDRAGIELIGWHQL